MRQMEAVLVLGLAAGVSLRAFAGEGAAPAPSPPPAQALAPGMVRALVIEQEARGLPDMKPDEAARQKVILDSAGNRIQLVIYKGRSKPAAPGEAERPAEVDRRIILRMSVDPPEITEIWDSSRSFRKTTRDLNRVQEDRDQWEANTIRHFPDMTAAERKQTMEENFLRADGKRIVEVVQTGGKEKILDHEAEEIKVFENGRTVIQAWVTKGVPGARHFFNLYRKLGAFSAQVLDRVSQIEAFPLKADFTVVTAAPAYTISAICLSVKTEDVPMKDFEVPDGYRERREEPGIAACEWCKKPLEPDEARSKWRDFESGRTLYFDDMKCRDAYLKGRRTDAANSPDAPGSPPKVDPPPKGE